MKNLIDLILKQKEEFILKINERIPYSELIEYLNSYEYSYEQIWENGQEFLTIKPISLEKFHTKQREFSENILLSFNRLCLVERKGIVFFLCQDSGQKIPADSKQCRDFFKTIILSKEINQFKKLVFNESLNLSNLEITVMPDNLFTEGDNHKINFSNNKIFQIPDNYIQTEDIDLSNNFIKYLPNKYLSKGYSLNLTNNRIKTIPNGFEQYGNIILTKNYIQRLPDDYKQNGFDLILNENRINSFNRKWVMNGKLEILGNISKQKLDIPKNILIHKDFIFDEI